MEEYDKVKYCFIVGFYKQVVVIKAVKHGKKLVQTIKTGWRNLELKAIEIMFEKFWK